MDQEDKKLYLSIVKKAFMILLLSMLIVMLLTQDIMYMLSVVIGGVLSLLGFVAVIYSVNTMSMSGNVKGKVVGAYLFRYVIYFLVMYAAAKTGFDILSMLVGFLCVNLGIKVNTLLERREENGFGK